MVNGLLQFSDYQWTIFWPLLMLLPGLDIVDAGAAALGMQKLPFVLGL